MQPGRKSSAANIVPLPATSPRTVLTPVGLPLTKEERLYFDHVARSHHHLKPIDVPVLMLFAASIVRAMKARRQDDETFEKEARAALALARSLRLTPQSTTEPKTAARRRAEAGSTSYYEVMRQEREE
jgi:hypothetical protein